MTDNLKKSLLILADISGYTNFMLANSRSLSRSNKIISELLLTVIRHIGLNLTISKIEGDAVFLYAMRGSEEEWKELHERLGEKLVSFFNIFRQKIDELKNSVLCEGDACEIIDSLAVKFIIHSGLSEEVEIEGFRELAGIDVIILHRLLKNSINEKEYILLTETACAEMSFPQIICLDRSSETVAGLGKINYFVYHPSHQKQPPC